MLPPKAMKLTEGEKGLPELDEVERLWHSQDRVGEGPLWDAAEQALYWVDIEQNVFHRLYLGGEKAGQAQTFGAGVMVGAVALREAGGLLLATQRGLGRWDDPTSPITWLVNPEQNKPNNRFNDGKVDSRGRFWAGTMSLNPDPNDPQGSLYRFDPDGSVHVMETNLTISNGLGWSPDNKLFYLTDSPKHVIYVYDYDEATGALANRRVFVQTPEDEGVPDGLAIDSEGCIWSARWGGWKISRFTPDGKLEREIKMPVENPSSCAFGGPDMDELFITSAWSGMNSEQRANQPQAGDVFRLKAGVRGLEVARAAF